MIKIHDDKKGKHQSFTAQHHLTDSIFSSNGHIDFDLIGWGENEEEAITNLKAATNTLITTLHSEEYTKTIEMDYMGKVKENE